jgi:hypothetical protein
LARSTSYEAPHYAVLSDNILEVHFIETTSILNNSKHWPFAMEVFEKWHRNTTRKQNPVKSPVSTQFLYLK